MPFLIVWGERDPIIPVAHGQAAHELVPRQPARGLRRTPATSRTSTTRSASSRCCSDFIDTTEPADIDSEAWRDMLKSGRTV